MKKLLQTKFVKKVIAPIVRGTLKTIPGGNIAVEIFQNFQGEKRHNYLSISIQIIGILAIIYAFITKAISIEQLLTLLGQF
jgi:hypothetical protein